MNIIKKSAEKMTTRELYMLTMAPNMNKMRDAIDTELEIKAWCLYEDVDKKTGEVIEILSIMTTEDEVYATNSPTFRRDFSNIVSLFESVGEKFEAIKVIGGTSKTGREFITCTLV